MAFIDALERETNYKFTENGAVTHKSTLNDCLDFFGKIGAMRGLSVNDRYSAFLQAYQSEPLTAIRTLFYGRDIRGGLGERDVFRTIYRKFATEYPKEAAKNVKLIPFFGRWDDLYSLVGTPVESAVIEAIKAEHEANSENSLMYKWLKSVNSSSKETNRLGRWTAEVIFSDTKDSKYYKKYRNILTSGREKANVVEQKMSKNEWSNINYNFLTSYNMIKYLKAFYKHDEERFFNEFFKVLKADIVFPYDILCRVRNNDDNMGAMYAKFWDCLPDYTEGNSMNTIVVADTSGSMDMANVMGENSKVTPMDSCLALAIYFAEHLQGEFHNRFINFSDNPTLQKLVGNNLQDKLQSIDYNNWSGSTNIEAVFDLLLTTGLTHKVSDSEMPQRILILSDMEFNSCAIEGRRGNGSRFGGYGGRSSSKFTFIDSMKAKYSDAGYTFPQLVFWNIGRAGSFHMTTDDNGFIVVSGNSPRAFESILKGETIVEETITVTKTVVEKGVSRQVTETQTVRTVKIDPVDAMMNTVHAERYEIITL